MLGNTSNFVCQENGLTAGEARTLAYVAFYPASRETALAAQMNVEPMTLVTILDRLESRGLVPRSLNTDWRAKIVQLAPDAQPSLEQDLAITQNVQERAMQDFRPNEIEMLQTLLKRLRANIAGTEPAREQGWSPSCLRLEPLSSAHSSWPSAPSAWLCTPLQCQRSSRCFRPRRQRSRCRCPSICLASPLPSLSVDRCLMPLVDGQSLLAFSPSMSWAVSSPSFRRRSPGSLVGARYKASVSLRG